MKFLKRTLQILFVLFTLGVNAQDTIKTMFYNVLEFPSAYPANRADILRDILNEYDPDIFMICELENNYGANLILDISLNDNGNKYQMAQSCNY